MSDDLYFTIEWHKRRKTIHIDDSLTIDEKHESAEQALLIAESLFYCFSQAAISNELSNDDRFAFFAVREKLFTVF